MPTIVQISVGSVDLEGALSLPDETDGLVIFAHGSGSSRHSPRNQSVAEILRDRGMGTLLFDLLTPEEDRDRSNRFDVELLTDRLVAVTEWLLDTHVPHAPLGYFGSSTGAAAALRGAARRPVDVSAVVSRGGRVDLASSRLPSVQAPTLLVVGGDDTAILERNETALESLPAESTLHIVDGAGHLFEGPGELEEVAEVAAEWFEHNLE